MVRAAGSYPAGRWFESDRRYQNLRPRGQAVKTSPFHGGNRGSIPLGVTKSGGIAQLGERLPYKQDVIGSSPIVSTKPRIRAQDAPLSLRTKPRRRDISLRPPERTGAYAYALRERLFARFVGSEARHETVAFASTLRTERKSPSLGRRVR